MYWNECLYDTKRPVSIHTCLAGGYLESYSRWVKSCTKVDILKGCGQNNKSLNFAPQFTRERTGTHIPDVWACLFMTACTNPSWRNKSLTYEAYDATDKGVEVTTVSCHDGFLLGQESFPRRLHHVHGHLADENLHTRMQETQEEEQI